jgi:putative ABC transport system substrate-binding protein
MDCIARAWTRRCFLEATLALAVIWLLAGCGVLPPPARTPVQSHRIGFLAAGSVASAVPGLEAFRQGLSELGYVEGRDVVIEVRAAEGREERLGELATELVDLDVDVVLTGGSEAVRAALQATTTIPIVFATSGDPVAEGLIESLARPGRNATGLTLQAGEEYPKRLQLLKEAFPSTARVGVLWNPRRPGPARETEAAAQALGVQVLSLELSSPDDLDRVMAAAIIGRADSLMVVTDAVLQPLAPQIVSFAARNRLPAMYGTSTYARAGGLLTYGVNIPGNYRRAATIVDKILNGANPGDLPVQQPTRFDFTVNLKTAGELGLAIPPSVLAQATEVIQ